MTVRQISIGEVACRFLLQTLDQSQAPASETWGAFLARKGVDYNSLSEDDKISISREWHATWPGPPQVVQHIDINAMDPLDPVHLRNRAEATFDRARELDERGLPPTSRKGA